MSRRNKTLRSRMHDVLSKKRVNARQLSNIGVTRHDVKKSTGQHAQKDYIWADQSYKNHIARMRQFSNWLNEKHPDLKKMTLDMVDREILKEYLVNQSERGLSASTVSADMAMLNKIFEAELTKTEIGLASRRIDEFVNNREGRSFHELQPKEKDAVLISRALGCRRSELLKLNGKSLYKTDDGKVYVYISGKGGRVRVAECLEGSQKWIEERFEGHVNRIGSVDELSLDRADYNVVTSDSERLIDNVRSNAPIHRLGRQYYAQELLRQVQREGRKGELLEQNKAKHTQYYKTNGYVMKRYHAQIVSQNLGHSRIDVLKNYVH